MRHEPMNGGTHRGTKFRLERIRQGLTLRQLAEKSGLSATHLSKIERGVSSPTVRVVHRIASALNQPSDFFTDSSLPSAVFAKYDSCARWMSSCGSIRLQFPCAKAPSLEFSSLILEMEPGATLEDNGWPVAARELSLYIVAGSCAVSLDSMAYQLEQGDSMWLEEPVGYSFKNDGEEPLVAFVSVFPRIRV